MQLNLTYTSLWTPWSSAASSQSQLGVMTSWQMVCDMFFVSIWTWTGQNSHINFSQQQQRDEEGETFPRRPSKKKSLNFMTYWVRWNFLNFVSCCFWLSLNYLDLFIMSTHVVLRLKRCCGPISSRFFQLHHFSQPFPFLCFLNPFSPL